MRNKTLFIVPTAKQQADVKAYCPRAEVQKADIDLDAVDVAQTTLVLIGGIDFMSQMAGRLVARYASEKASFKLIMPPRLSGRIQDIRRLFNDAGLAGKYEIIVPLGGYIRQIAQIASETHPLYA